LNPSRLLAAALLVSALCACGDNDPAEGEATGEVLEGTISDEMLPLDRVRSEAPLADRTGTRRSDGGGVAESQGAGVEEPMELDEAPTEAPAEEE